MEKLLFCQGKPLSLVVLAGGHSRRMKRLKALLHVPEGTLVERIIGQLEGHFDEVLVSVSEPERFGFLGRRLVVDELPGQGPMMGVKCALQESTNERNFVIACDIPDIDLTFLKELIAGASGFEIAVPVSPEGKLEPLFAVYSRSVLEEMEKLLASGIRSLLPLFDLCRTAKLRMSGCSWFKNINTPEDYRKFIESLRS